MLYMFHAGFPSTIRGSKLHIQRQVLVRPILLPRWEKMEGHCSTGQSPQWAVVPMEEEEEEEEEEDVTAT